MDDKDDPIVCRCEGIRRSQILAAVRSGDSLRDLKQRTRLGMGECQGRVCLPIAMQVAGTDTLPAVRSPLRPLRLSLLEGTDQP